MAQRQKMEQIKRETREEKNRKDMLHALENEKRDRLLENERRDRKTLEQKMEQKMDHMKMEAALENEKRDRELERKDLEQKMDHMKIEAALENEKRDLLLENEKRDRLLENERRHRKDLEQKMDHMKMEAALHVENEKRDRLLENEKRDRESENKDLEQKMEAALENEKRDHLLENEKRDRLLEDERRVRQAEKKEVEMMAALALEKVEREHQIEQLKSDARISQMEQQLLEVQAYTSQGISIIRPTIQHNAAVDHAPQRDTELLLLHHTQQIEKERELLKTTASAAQPASTPNGDTTSPLEAPDTSHKIPEIALQPVPQRAAVVPQASKVPLHQQQAPSILSQQASAVSSHKPGNEPSEARSSKPSKTTQQQHKVKKATLPQGTGEAKGGAVPLPGDSHTHFFLGHCQSSGGDQTNAIYLELRQLGFTCWYDNRADDLTKEGMRKGIVHAAAFLLFLSKGVLDRPFCE
jgi:hypothetical protein